MKGLGVQAVREKIAQAFRSIHHDQRDRAQVQNDRELLSALGASDCTMGVEIETPLCSEAVVTFTAKAEALASLALRSPHVSNHSAQRTNVGGAWVIEIPTEDAATLFAEALRQLGHKR